MRCSTMAILSLLWPVASCGTTYLRRWSGRPDETDVDDKMSREVKSVGNSRSYYEEDSVYWERIIQQASSLPQTPATVASTQVPAAPAPFSPGPPSNPTISPDFGSPIPFSPGLSSTPTTNPRPTPPLTPPSTGSPVASPPPSPDSMPITRRPISSPAPTNASPTTTVPTLPVPAPAPTPLPTLSDNCHLVATSECSLFDGGPCSGLTTIPMDMLTCNAFPSQLGWVYLGEDCGELDNLQTGFICKDLNGGPSSTVVVYLSVVGTNTGLEYYSGLLFREGVGFPSSTFVMTTTNPLMQLDSSVRVTVKRRDIEGELLQSMIIQTLCSTDDDLAIGNRFGSIQLESYRNGEAGLVKGSQQVQWEYVTRNDGVEDTKITSLTTTTHGDVRDIMPMNDVILEPGQVFRVPVPKSVSLIESGEYSGTVLARGESPDGDCSGTATSSFEVV